MENFDKLVGGRLMWVRKRLGFSTQKAFAERLGLKYQSYVNYEKGIRSLPNEVKLKLHEIGININYLITGEGPMFIMSSDEIKSNKNELSPVSHQIPVLRQKVSCGPGQEWNNESNIERYVTVFDILPRLRTGKVYAFPVSGSSMLGAGIRDGDIVLFDADKSQDTQDGTYVFVLDGDVYCKRLEFDSLTRQIKVYSVRVADLEKAELAMSLKADDPATAERLTIFGRVHAWIHPEDFK